MGLLYTRPCFFVEGFVCVGGPLVALVTDGLHFFKNNQEAPARISSGGRKSIPEICGAGLS